MEQLKAARRLKQAVKLELELAIKQLLALAVELLLKQAIRCTKLQVEPDWELNLEAL